MQKHRLQRIIAFVLIAITLTSIVPFSSNNHSHKLTVYANGDTPAVEGNENSQGGTGKLESGYKGDTSAIYSKYNQGYRFYIVDALPTKESQGSKDPVRVSDVFDFTFRAPGDDITQFFTNGRYEALSKDKSQYHNYSIADLADKWCAGAKNADGIKAIYPITEKGGVFYPHGTEFKEWFFAGADGFSRPSGESSGVTEISKGGGTGGGTIVNPTVEKYNCFFCKGTGYEVLRCVY